MPSNTQVSLKCAFCGCTFWVEKYRETTAITCSRMCHNTRIAREHCRERGDRQRYSGEGKSYVKLYGRHMHRVLAEQKIGRPLQPGEMVHHIDGNFRNNHPDNLQIVSRSEHIKIHRGDMEKNAFHPVGEDSPNHKLSVVQVVEIRARCNSGESFASIAKSFGITAVNVRYINSRRTWKHVP